MSKKSSGTSTPSKVQQQKENAAKIAAEKLTAPVVETLSLATAPVVEPTLAERMEAIKRRAMERAKEEQQSLASQYLQQTRSKFKKLISELPEDSEIKTVFNELSQIENLLDGEVAPTAPKSPAATGERKRASSKELTAVGERILEILSKSEFTLTSSIADKIGEAKETVTAALAKLKRDNKIKSNGERGSNGAIKLA